MPPRLPSDSTATSSSPLPRDSAPSEWLAQLERDRAIAVIRTDTSDLALKLAEIAIAAGVNHVEIIATIPAFDRAIAQLRQRYPARWIGAGTVVTADTATRAIAAGAQFLFSPYSSAAALDRARAHRVPIVPGALTPQEIGSAWQAGATAVKVFPISCVGGAEYVRALRSPLAGIPLIPTGGVTVDNANELLAAGAIAVGLATQLFPKDLVKHQSWDEIGDRIHAFVRSLAS